MTKPAKSSPRLPAPDALRGIIMILMALDHASYFIAKVHRSEFWGVPLPVYDDALQFLTRFVTHVCAPGFFFLMGAGMVLFAEARREIGWSDGKIIRSFIVRGALLIGLQLLVENPAWALGLLSGSLETVKPPGASEDAIIFHFGVLWALGAAMLFWSFWRRIPWPAAAGVSLLAIACGQAFVPGADQANTAFSPWLRLLLITGQTGSMQVLYPLVPWLGVTGLGILFGRLLRRNQRQAYRVALGGGLACAVGFVLLRAVGDFGDFHARESGWIGFLNVTKYPPSLAFLLFTLGVNLLFLWLLAKAPARWYGRTMPLLVFGRTPLFFYLVHLYLFALIGLAFPRGAPSGVMYLVWLLGLALLFPLCLWYHRLKTQRPPESLWRFF